MIRRNKNLTKEQKNLKAKKNNKKGARTTMKEINMKDTKEVGATTAVATTAVVTTTDLNLPVQEESNDKVKVIKSGNLTIVKYDDTQRNRKFEKLVTKSQSDLKEYLANYFVKEGKNITKGKGYLYVDGTNPVMLTAHLDTVHKELPKQLVYEEGMVSSPQGIGGDDRCGVYAIMRILKEIDCPVVFCEDEETGGEGGGFFINSKIFKKLKKEDRIKYVIELDRKGKNDAVYYSLDNEKFEDFIEENYWKNEWGSFSDICTICPALGVAGVNLSVGYYKQHTIAEYVVLKELDQAIEETKKLIKRTDPEVKFEYIESKYAGWNRGWGGYGSWYDDYDKYWGSYGTSSKKPAIESDFYYIKYYGMSGEEVSFVEAVSEVEAIGQFLIDNPDLSYKDVFDFGLEEDYDWSIEEKYGYDSVTL